MNDDSFLRGSPSAGAILIAGLLIVIGMGGSYLYLHKPVQSGGPFPLLAPGACPTAPKVLSLGGSASGSLTQVAAGGTLSVSGMLKNMTGTTLPEARLFVHVLRRDGATNAVVDEFSLPDTFPLASGDTHTFAFTWKVPEDAEDGSYTAAVSVASTDYAYAAGSLGPGPAAAASYSFSVVGGQPGTVAFDPASFMAAGLHQNYLNPAFRLNGSEPVPVSVDIHNDTGAGMKAALTWNVYAGLFPVGTPLSSTSDTVKLQPNATTTVQYTLTDSAYSAYYVEAVLTTPQGSKSFFAFPALNAAFAVKCRSLHA